MDAFTGFGYLPGNAGIKINEDGTVDLPRISILTATSAANSGVSSNQLKTAMHKGFPFSYHDLVQEMGRVNRTQLMDDCCFQIHASLSCFISAFVRIMTNKESSERARTASHLWDVLRLLITPEQCYHKSIEKYFEWNVHTPGQCENMCSYCCGATKTFTGLVNRMQVVGVLTAVFHANPEVHPDVLKEAIKSSKKKIFVVPSKFMGQIHGLILQMIANNILSLHVGDSNKLGKDTLTTKDVVVKLSTTLSGGILQPAYMLPEMWTNMTIQYNSILVDIM